MSRWLIVALVVLGVALLAYDPNVPLDTEDYWIILFVEKIVKLNRLKRFFLGGSVVEDELPLSPAPSDRLRPALALMRSDYHFWHYWYFDA